ncbi:unnamed protein product [Thlaspi arvense]|uniref:Uncharacterized protein n=1 Tax=Thlaspi arvense TaxID=13288 RepID=A0AAU9RP11_THLAR|nr:unnamed protein product [Thlaspi arvense]
MGCVLISSCPPSSLVLASHPHQFSAGIKSSEIPVRLQFSPTRRTLIAKPCCFNLPQEPILSEALKISEFICLRMTILIASGNSNSNLANYIYQLISMEALEAISEGKFDEAIDHLTKAIMLNPTSAILYATRVKKPNAAIRDANVALQSMVSYTFLKEWARSEAKKKAQASKLRLSHQAYTASSMIWSCNRLTAVKLYHFQKPLVFQMSSGLVLKEANLEWHLMLLHLKVWYWKSLSLYQVSNEVLNRSKKNHRFDFM